MTDIKRPTPEELEKMTMSEMFESARQPALKELRSEGVRIKNEGPNERRKKRYNERIELIKSLMTDSRFWELVDNAKKK